MKATERIAQDHQYLVDVLDEVEVTADEIGRIRLLTAAAERLKRLNAMEEDVFYPALRSLAPIAVENALAAHRALDIVLDEAFGTPSRANLNVLRGVLAAHIEAEEEHLFPLADALDREAGDRLAGDLERYATALQEERAAETERPAGRAARALREAMSS